MTNIINFQDLGFSPELLQAIQHRGYTKATPIQQQAIPPALEGRDLLACAQTGTGKTAAFALPILHRLNTAKPQNGSLPPNNDTQYASGNEKRAAQRRRPIRALVLVPTRELAVQVAESFATYGKGLKLRQTTIFGGVNARPQIDALRRGVDIVVATPGRLLDLHSQGFLNFDQVQTLVLDEADQMFDMGFIRDVRKIIRYVPRSRQTLMYSATLPPQIRELARECLKQPISISASPETVTPVKIEQQVFYLQTEDKPAALTNLLYQNPGQRTLVFCRTKHGADKVARKLTAAGIKSFAVHGNKSQNARQAALRAFNESEAAILVATDVAARGLHMPDVKIVVNYELSDTPETYIHRIGRTARAEATGRAVTFCAPNDRSLLRRIEALTKVRMNVLPSSGESPNGSNLDDAEVGNQTIRRTEGANSASGNRPVRSNRSGSWSARRRGNSANWGGRARSFKAKKRYA